MIPDTAPRLTMREVGWFFFPLLLNVQMMSISHSVINAALARVSDAITALAAFAVAMVFQPSAAFGRKRSSKSTRRFSSASVASVAGASRFCSSSQKANPRFGARAMVASGRTRSSG